MIHDNLSAHFTAARRVSGFDWNKTDAVPSYHGALFDRCAQLNDGHGGGSLTALALVESVPSGPNNVSIEHIKSREMVANTCSLADNVIRLSRDALKAGALLPINFEDLCVYTGHISQGAALRHYSTRMRETLCDLRETSRNVMTAMAMGVTMESDNDYVLDLQAKARLMLVPTHNGLRYAMEAANSADSQLSAEAVAKIGLQGLHFGSRSSGGTAGSSSGSDGASAASSGAAGSNSTIDALSALSGTAPNGALAAAAAGFAIKAPGSSPRQQQSVRSFSTLSSYRGATIASASASSAAVASAPPARATGARGISSSSPSLSSSASSGPVSDDSSGIPKPVSEEEQRKAAERKERLLSRMDPTQRAAYLAIQQKRERKTGAAMAAQAASGGLGGG